MSFTGAILTDSVSVQRASQATTTKGARPYFSDRQLDRDNVKESAAAALEAARRFARLQYRFGPRGLAYLEAVFKSAKAASLEMSTRSLAARSKKIEFRWAPTPEPRKIIISIVNSKGKILYEMRLGPGVLC